MDQTNPLAEITHKRRLSALGPGGLRERELDLRYVMFTIRTTDVYVPLKQPLGVYAKMEWVSLKHLTKSNGVVFPGRGRRNVDFSRIFRWIF
jgi:hypothetical protein